MNDSKIIFTKKKWVVIFALTAVFTWGFAFPLIKLGLNEFAINDSIGSKTLFAGIRFFFAGLIILLVAKIKGESIRIKQKENILWVLVFGIVNTTLHYFFFYIGLSNCTGSKSSMFDSLATFLLVIFACIVFKDEHMTKNKVFGCFMGLIGMIIINAGENLGSGLTFMGDGMLVINAIFSACGGILTRIVGRKVTALVATGYSLLTGGFWLIIIGVLLDGKITVVTGKGIFYLFCLIMVSVIGFSLYNQLVCVNPVGEIAIFNCFIPAFGTMLSCVLLNEVFQIKYLFALIFIAVGVYSVNKIDKK